MVSLGYDIYRSDRARFGVGIGAHVVDFDLEVTSNLNVAEDNVGSISGSEDLTAPLPNLYAGGLYAFRNNLLFKYSAGWMSMSYEDYDGDLVFAQGSMEYWPYEHIGLGAGYVYRSADIEYTPNNKKETYDIKMPGPVFYLTVGF